MLEPWQRIPMPARAAAWMLACALPAAAAEATVGTEAPARDWDITVGAVLNHAPAFAGAAEQRSSLQPGLALRWKRLGLATRSAFAVFAGDEPAAARGGGLRLDLIDSRRWRVGIGLRAETGRDASASPALAGLGEVRKTLLVRASLSYRFDEQTRLTTTLLADALGRGSGRQWIASATRDWPVATATTLTLAASLIASDRRHHETWYGVTPAQSQASGYTVHRPGGGLSSASLALSARTRLDRHWGLFGGLAATRLLGPAANSPFVKRPAGYSASVGILHAF
jgi:MipA family protein